MPWRFGFDMRSGSFLGRIVLYGLDPADLFPTIPRMAISYANIQCVLAHQVGNILKNEGIDSSRPAIECSAQTQRHLGKLIVRLAEKCAPYVEKKSSGGFSVIDVFNSALRDQDAFAEKSLKLATRLYETGRHLQIPSSAFLTLLFETKNDNGDVLQGIALLAVSSGTGGLVYRANADGKSLDYVEAVNEGSLDRAAVWLQGSGKVHVPDKKNIPVKFWIEQFLNVKPVLTENKAAAAASQWIRKISEQIDSAKESSEYKQKMKEMLGQASSVSFDEIEACSKEYLDEESLNDIRERIEKQTSLSLRGEYELPAQVLHQKVQQFVKTMRLSSKLDVTIKGKQEVISMEQLSSDEADTILIKLKLKEAE